MTTIKIFLDPQILPCCLHTCDTGQLGVLSFKSINQPSKQANLTYWLMLHCCHNLISQIWFHICSAGTASVTYTSYYTGTFSHLLFPHILRVVSRWNARGLIPVHCYSDSTFQSLSVKDTRVLYKGRKKAQHPSKWLNWKETEMALGT